MAAITQRQSRWYTWREEFKTFVGIDSSVTDKDTRIDALIASQSALLERKTGRRFIPWTGTKEYDFQHVSQLILGDDLLSVTTLSDDDGAIAATDFWLYPLNAADDGKPYTWIELLFTDDLFQYDDTKQSTITIAGKWGYCELTRDSGATVNGAHNATTTTLAVSDGTKFDYGQTLLVGTEQMWVSNISGNNLTVSRGVNGTTAASHSNGDTVNVIEPPDDIRLACDILVARALHRADAAWSDRIGTPEQGFTYLKAIPADVRDVIRNYRRMIFTPPRLTGREAAVGRYGFRQQEQ